MEPNRIRIWRFAKAPRELRSLHGFSDAEWLVLIPRLIWGIDLEDVIRERADPGSLSRYETPNGDVVYTGRRRVCQVLQVQAAAAGRLLQ